MARFRLSSLWKRERPAIDLTSVDRYWREANGGDPYLALYHRARTLSDSNDNAFKQNRLFTLHQMARRVVDDAVPGDVVECGCWRGHSTWLMAEPLRAAAWPGRFFVFDSFEGGLSDKVAADRAGRGATSPERTREQKLSFASSFAAVEKLMRPFPFVSLHKGWIPQVFGAVPGLAELRFALIHIDVDLYEPTRDCLAYFGPRMSEGGVIVIDDYGSANFPGSRTAVDEYRAAHRPRLFLESHLIGAVMLV